MGVVAAVGIANIVPVATTKAATAVTSVHVVGSSDGAQTLKDFKALLSNGNPAVVIPRVLLLLRLRLRLLLRLLDLLGLLSLLDLLRLLVLLMQLLL